MKNTQQEKKESAIKGILIDYVIWSRVYIAMDQALNSFNPYGDNRESWSTDLNYNGYVNTYSLLGIDEEEDLCQELADILHDVLMESELDARKIAEQVYLDWLICIRGYSLKSTQKIINN